jgi:hypothetical protein
VRWVEPAIRREMASEDFIGAFMGMIACYVRRSHAERWLQQVIASVGSSRVRWVKRWVQRRIESAGFIFTPGHGHGVTPAMAMVPSPAMVMVPSPVMVMVPPPAMAMVPPPA